MGAFIRRRPSTMTLTLLTGLGLTRRETEVALWLAQGKTNAEISVILNIGVRTVDKHLEHILDKLCVENRTTAAIQIVRALAAVPTFEKA
ncbi:MAG: helix-turn-helix transcriptional regulator [Vicinamibacterales bacterium]